MKKDIILELTFQVCNTPDMECPVLILPIKNIAMLYLLLSTGDKSLYCGYTLSKYLNISKNNNEVSIEGIHIYDNLNLIITKLTTNLNFMIKNLKYEPKHCKLLLDKINKYYNNAVTKYDQELITAPIKLSTNVTCIKNLLDTKRISEGIINNTLRNTLIDPYGVI